MKHLYKILLLATILTILPSIFSFNTTELNAEEQLGKELFYDGILSQDQTLSCASCHKPEHAFADNVALSEGLFGQLTARNTPSAMNMRAYNSFAWDGRNKTLETQSLRPIQDFAEMGIPVEEAVARLINDEHYNASFRFVYSSIPSQETLGKALAAYQRTLFSPSAYDRYVGGAENAISESAKRGLELFSGKAECVNCHMGDDFTNGGFENIGTYNGKEYNDKGRGKHTKKKEDYGKFKVPSLRNVALTAPYMHDGSIKTLRETIEYYNTPRKFRPDAIGRDPIIPEALNLTEQEIVDLEEFLKTLSGDDILQHSR
jgi:cytochrome c peroxidase